MTQEQLSKMVMSNCKAIAGITEKLASAHKRIDDNDRITEGIHKIASNVESLTVQVKNLTERLDKSLQSMEAQLKAQGERIKVLESKPGKKWEAVAEKVLLVVVGGLVAFIMAKIGM